MVRCREGDALGLFRHCGRVTCDSPIGPACFGIETEAQERMSTGPTITCSDDIAGMRRPHGRLVTKAVRPHSIDRAVFSVKIKEI